MKIEKIELDIKSKTGMIQSAKIVLIQAGLPVERFYSDAFVCSATN